MEFFFSMQRMPSEQLHYQYDCPALKCTVINTYRRATKIFVLGGLEIWSNEGTTQGCPLAMAMYAVAIIPLQELLHEKCFADDGTGGDTIKKMRNWWDCVAKNGPKFGYFPKASKSWLIVKDHKLKEAERNLKKLEFKSQLKDNVTSEPQLDPKSSRQSTLNPI